MSTLKEHRIRPAKDKEELIQRLLSDEGPFSTRWEILVFAAALGWSRERRDPLEKPGEGIRYALFANYPTVAALIDSLGVLTSPSDASIMSDDRLGERIAIFEEYANGGLAIIQGELNATQSRPMDVLLGLCRDAGAESKNDLRSLFGQGFTAPTFP